LKWCVDELNPNKVEQVNWSALSISVDVLARCREAALNEPGA